MFQNNITIEGFFSFFNLFRILSPVDMVRALIEIVVIAFMIYHILIWIKNTRALVLLRGIIAILLLVLLAHVFELTVLLAIMRAATVFLGIALVIVFQNDIRSGLEHIGRNSMLLKIIPDIGKFTKKTSDSSVDEIVTAAFAMGKVKTGALIVIEQRESLEEIEHTGILIDGRVSKQLLINIFEKNTPLHDGAVLIVGDVLKAATCYLPLSRDKNISKDLGTRHRAALGVSEAFDSITIVVSEETGKVSVCYMGKLEIVNDERALSKILKDNMYSEVAETKKDIFSSMKDWFSNAR